MVKTLPKPCCNGVKFNLPPHYTPTPAALVTICGQQYFLEGSGFLGARMQVDPAFVIQLSITLARHASYAAYCAT